MGAVSGAELALSPRGMVESSASREPIAGLGRAVREHVCFAGLVVGALLVGAPVWAGSARAAFPGRDGLLAVQPLTGPGIVLINANGRAARRLCAEPADVCSVPSPGRLVRPQWSPDGGALMIGKRALAEDPNEGFEVIYPDGSCLDCLEPFDGWADAVFTSNPTLLTAVTVPPDNRAALVEYGVDGLRRSVLLSGAVSDPVWSSRGELALVRGGWIWVGSPRTLRRVARGSAPSWSPDGSQIVFDRRGWLMLGAVHGRSFRRLVRGSAPAWSPGGRSIAFFDRRHRLSLVPAAGGRVHKVGGVAGLTVDWQPLPATPPARCLTPPGSTVVASSDSAIITASAGQSPYYPYPAGSAEMSCLRADGRERLLSSDTQFRYSTGVGPTEVALAAPYAAFAGTAFNSHDQTMVSSANVFDLRTGLRVSDRGGEGSMCLDQSSPPCASSIDQLVLGSDAVSAVHTTVRDATCEPVQAPNCSDTVEQIQASDRTGVHTVDSVSEPDGAPAALTNLALSGDTLTWDDTGAQRSAQLQP